MKIPFISELFLKRPVWVKMSVDKLFFEAHSDLYFLILKAMGKKEGKTVFLTLGHVLDENLMPQLLGQADRSFGMLDRLGLTVKNIRILRKVNAPDSAVVTFGRGFFRRTAKISTMEAVKMAMETSRVLDVPADLIKADQYNLKDTILMASRVQSSIFSPKYIERDFNIGQEVVM